MKRFLEQVEKRAKREYSQGRHGAADEGDLALAVTADHEHGTVVIDFGKPVAWIGLGPKEVAGLVKLLVAKAREVSREPLTIDIGE